MSCAPVTEEAARKKIDLKQFYGAENVDGPPPPIDQASNDAKQVREFPPDKPTGEAFRRSGRGPRPDDHGEP